MSRPPSRIRGAMPPPARRQPTVRASSVTSHHGRSSPSGSIASIAGVKRKEREFDPDASSITISSRNENATNINVYVRCRGRNEREIRENSGVVVSTDGVKGKTVELSMGSNGGSKKTYFFDRVFSPAADQNLIFDEVLKPILEDVMGGLNCTVFAYGQTGTGKTYTMCGDVTDQLPLPEGAGIIPRVLHALFSKIDALPNSPNSGKTAETSVKCSFIELYNEELRDLLSSEDNPKLKIVDGDAKRGNSALVQGMEEKYLSSFEGGIKQLRQGSYRRQVAATKCNDLSSRSHTVFTITVHIKKTTEAGEEYIINGKLNLVDLAGSENIKSSGAENKRAVEAGLINKSLLTLGRVINALVDRSPHIPYRESKLTRLLQDSLGGRTKTCIIATLSPAKSNIDETLSTLNYAFRAKDIRNMPQINPSIPKNTHLKELTAKIEKLKTELMVTRQKNGVFLTQENYEEMTNESESRRIQIKEQQERLETIECNLKNRVAELHTLNETVKFLKDDNESTRTSLDNIKSLLQETESLLETTKREVLEEIYVREQYQKTEGKLVTLNQKLLTTLDSTTSDISGLQSKLRRRSDLHSTNKTHWFNSQKDIAQTTKLVEERLQKFGQQQQTLVEQAQQRIGIFFQEEKVKNDQAKAELDEKAQKFDVDYNQVVKQASESKVELNKVLDEIKVLRSDVKDKVGEGLKDLGKAAEDISAGIMTELDAFGSQLHNSYAGLGRDFKSLFEELTNEMQSQREQISLLQKQMSEANSRLANDTQDSLSTFDQLMEKENSAREQENKDIMAQIEAMMLTRSRQQDARMQEIAQFSSRVQSASANHTLAASSFLTGSEGLLERSEVFTDQISKSRDAIKTRIQSDFAASNLHTEKLKEVSNSVHKETTRITHEQIQHLDTELQALDDIVARIQDQNNVAHEDRVKSIGGLASNVKTSYKNVEGQFSDATSRSVQANLDMTAAASKILNSLANDSFEQPIINEILQLRERVETSQHEDYMPTGSTPRTKEYSYKRTIPRTADRSLLLQRLQQGSSDNSLETLEEDDDFLAPLELSFRSPSKGLVFNDFNTMNNQRSGTSTSSLDAKNVTASFGLRELDLNTLSGSNHDILAKSTSALHEVPPLKKIHTTGNVERKSAYKKSQRALRSTVAGKEGLSERENLTLPNLSASVGSGSVHPMGRRLRSRDR